MRYQVKKSQEKRLPGLAAAFNSKGRMLSNRAAAFSVEALLSNEEAKPDLQNEDHLPTGQQVPSLQNNNCNNYLEQHHSSQEVESTKEINQSHSKMGKNEIISNIQENDMGEESKNVSEETKMDEDEDIEIDVVYTDENCPNITSSVTPTTTKEDIQTSKSQSSNSSQVIRPQPIQATPHPLHVALHSVPMHPYHVHNPAYFLHPSAYPIHLPHHPIPFPLQVSPHIIHTNNPSVLNIQRQIHHISASHQNQQPSPKESMPSSSSKPINTKEGSESPQPIVQPPNPIVGWPVSPSQPPEPPWVSDRLAQARTDPHTEAAAVECVTVEDCEPTEYIGVVECAGGITVQLLQQDLWNRFHTMGTEMIITKNGRRMFPVVKVRLQGLKPTSQYMVYLTMRPLDNRRYRYVYPSSRWMVAGSGEPNEDQQMPYVHPDSPATGEQWMAAPAVAFDRLKLTNNKARARDTKGQICLHSMQKYRPEVWVQELGVAGSGSAWPELLGTLDTTVAHRASFPQTTFITVTAYQNQQITRLKIDSNPFAKGFRDSNKNKDGSERRHPNSKLRVEDMGSRSSPGPSGVPPQGVQYLPPHLPQGYPLLHSVALPPTSAAAAAMSLPPHLLSHHLLPPPPHGTVEGTHAHPGATLGLPPPWHYAHHTYFRYQWPGPPYVVVPPGVPHQQAVAVPSTTLVPSPSPGASSTGPPIVHEPGTSSTTSEHNVLNLTKLNNVKAEGDQADLDPSS